jgi:TonB family protein
LPSAGAQPPSADLEPFDYVPRRFLTVAPGPHGAILLPYPEGEAESDVVTFVLALYIDEQGRVRQARVDEGSPPERFATAAVASFMQARFEPGELQGQAVRSLVRVEVSYRASQ